MSGNPKKGRLLTRLRYDTWRRLLPRHLALGKGVRVLECGPGPGNLLRLLEEWFPEADFWGLDIAPDAIRQARQATTRVHLLVGSAMALPFAEERFDLVLSIHLVEHLDRPEEFLKEADRVLRPGGILALATPNPAGIGARVMGRRWSGWQPDHLSLLPPPEWREKLAKHGFSLVRQGTTGLAGIPLFTKLPLALFSWVPLFLFGFFPWEQGEAYISISRKAGPLSGT